ncbi:MAG: hypothetical protein JKY42_02575 [Flavobacteriales bacterium]|nr:hypothetical protein [Flavobacteriales bacterium]
MRKFICITMVVFLLASCEKDNVIGPQCVECPSDTLELDVVTKLFVINEGNFGWGNASLSLYDIENMFIQNQVYQTANEGNLLGDVAMSFEIINEKGYLTVNNSDKVVIVDLTTFEKRDEITSVNSPRFIKSVTKNKAYLTSLYAGEIYVIDLTDNSVASTIQTGGWTEELLINGQYAFVVNRDLDQLHIIDVSTDIMVESIQVGKSPNSVILDANNDLWVLCDGGFEEENAELIKISTADFSVLSTFQFSNIQSSPGDLAINGDGDVLYFLNQGVVKMKITGTALPASVLIQTDGKTFYGLEVDSQTGDIYVSDVKDYVQEGQIYRYTSEGLELDNFKVGIIPGTFTFYSE